MSGKYVSEDLGEEQKQHIANHIDYYKARYAKHKGEWLTDETCMEYREQAKKAPSQGNQDIGVRRRLREELQEKYGLCEVEAVNILDGVHSHEYVEKYKLIHAIQNVDEWVGPYLEKAKKRKNAEKQESESVSD